MKYYVIAGEASGDLHGSNLIREIKNNDPLAEFRAWGGDMMAAQGATLVKHYRELAFMGFVEVLRNLPTILRNINFCKKDILSFKPDALILIDYPGFNLRIAEWAKKEGIKVIYYISPQVWAWKESRVEKIKRDVDLMMVILPFEKEFYQKHQFHVEYVGHPLVEVIDHFIEEKNNSEALLAHNDEGIIALLPGSRKQEIMIKLPVMLQVAKLFPQHRFVVAKAPGLEDAFYAKMLSAYSNVQAVSGKTYDLLYKAKAALVTSGTATLETALFRVPEIVCYKGNAVSYQIAKRLIKVPYISLVNLIMGREIVKELIQHEFTVQNLTIELSDILLNNERKLKLQKDYEALHQLLSKGGNASANAAKLIEEFLEKRES